MAANNRSLTKLPNLSLEAILINLPLPSLLVCCCVSKSLLDLIKNDSDFARTHFATSEPQLMIQPLRDTHCHLIDSDADFTTAARVEIKPTFNLPLRFFSIAASCNGLLFLERFYTDRDFHQCLVYNPVTGEYIIIPETVYPCLNVISAFFYSPVSNQFKVFRVFHRSDSDYDSDSDTVFSVSDTLGELFVSGSDSWESLGNVPFSPLPLFSPCHLYSSTHWLCGDKNVKSVIVFFSFETHQFGEIAGPTCISKNHANGHDNVALIGLDNCLTIFDGLSTEGKFEVWKMREYGVVESWSRVLIIDTTLFSPYVQFHCFRPVMCRNNGEVVMISANRFMVIYNLLEKKGRIVNYRPLSLRCNIVVHTPSFISLRNVARGTNLEVLTVASRFINEELEGFNYLELTRTFSEEAD